MAYTFQFIADQRFGGSKEQLEKMDIALKSEFDQTGPHAILTELTGIRELWFPDNEKHLQWRKDYRIDKNGRVLTWNQIMKIINRIYAPSYKKVI